MLKIAITTVFFCLSLLALGQNPIEKYQGKVNGEVFAINVDEEGDRIYLGGRFSRAGDIASFGAMLDPVSGQVGNVNNQPSGNVNAVHPDGNGGYYIGGSFISVGREERAHLAHVDASGELSPWAANLNLNGQVSSIHKIGNTVYIGGSFDGYHTLFGSRGILLSPENDQVPANSLKVNEKIFATIPDGAGGYYIGGFFDKVGEEERRGLAHIKADGELSDWQPIVNGNVFSMVRSGSTVFIGGVFTEVNGQPRSNLAAVNSATGELEDWSPEADGLVSSLALMGDLVYAGGLFSQLGAESREAIGAINKDSGVVADWNPNPAGSITCLYTSDDRLYVGGRFNNIMGSDRDNLVAFLQDGTLIDWQPNPDGQVNAVEVSGDLVYIGGSFSQLGNENRSRLGAVDISTAEPNPWNPGITGPGANHVNSIKLLNGKVYVGGRFTSVGDMERNYLAEIDPNTGVATPWNPNVNGTVNVVAVSGNSIYAGGSYNGIGGGRQPYFIAVDAEDGNVLPFDAGVNGPVNAIAGTDETLYIGGRFHQVLNEPRDYLAAIDLQSQTIIPWTPNPTREIDGLLISENTLYVTGKFSEIGGEARKKIAAINTDDGTITSWDARITGSNDVVNSLVVAGNRVFVGGNFNSVGGSFRTSLAALDIITGDLLPWDPGIDLSFGRDITSLALLGNTIYVAGDFTDVGGVKREDLAAVDIDTGDLLDWAPASRAGARRNSISEIAISGSTIYVGGSFEGIGGEERQNAAALELSTGNVTTWNPDVGGNFSNLVFTIAQSDETIFMGGIFSTIGGLSRQNLVAVSTVDGKPTDWNPGVSGDTPWVNKLEISEDQIYVGGNFTSIGGNDKPFLAAVDINSGEVSDWNPNPDGSIGAISVLGDKIYVAGGFENIGGKQRARMAELSRATAVASEWSPVANGGVFEIVPTEDVVYVSGSFTEVNGVPRNLVAAINTATGMTEDWDAGIESVLATTFVISLTLTDNLLYAYGAFSAVNGQAQNSIAAFDRETAEHVSWNPRLRRGGFVRALVIAQGITFLGGSSIGELEQGTNSFSGFEAIEKNQSIQFGSLSDKVYGDSDFGLMASASSDLEVIYTSSDETVASVSGSVVSIVGAGEVSILASQPGNTQFLAAEGVSQSFIVKRAVLTAKAGDKEKIYGENNPTLTVQYTGFVNDDDTSDLTEPSVSTSATESSDAGTYEIALTDGASANYDFELLNGTLVIIKADLVAKARDITVNRGDGDFELVIDYTGFRNGDGPEQIDTPPIASTSATSESERGTYEITLTGGTDNNYNFTLTSGVLTVTGPVFTLPVSVDFGQVGLNTSVSETLTIENTGDGALVVTAVTLPSGFSIDAGAFTVTPGTTNELTLTFSPTDLRQYQGPAIISSNEGELQIELSGIAMLVTSIDDGFLEADEVKVYPNPTRDRLVIDFQERIAGDISARLVDTKGLSKWHVQGIASGKMALDVSDFESGVYLLRIEYRGKFITKKVVVKR